MFYSIELYSFKPYQAVQRQKCEQNIAKTKAIWPLAII